MFARILVIALLAVSGIVFAQQQTPMFPGVEETSIPSEELLAAKKRAAEEILSKEEIRIAGVYARHTVFLQSKVFYSWTDHTVCVKGQRLKIDTNINKYGNIEIWVHRRPGDGFRNCEGFLWLIDPLTKNASGFFVNHETRERISHFRTSIDSIK